MIQQHPLVFSLVTLFAGILIGIRIGALLSGRKASGPRPAKPQEKGKEKSREVPRSGSVVELYVGNLSYEVNGKELKKMFGEFGPVVSARIIENRFNGKSKGYGFVEMADSKSADAAIKAMNAKDFKGRKMVVNEAKSQARDD
jgi:RNA recognition motif-containing protein